MYRFTLHHFRRPSTVLKYALVLTLLASISLSIFSEWHNPAHVLKTDQHCALCISAHNFDHSLLYKLSQLTVPAAQSERLVVAQSRYVPSFIRITGNRDPPELHLI